MPSERRTDDLLQLLGDEDHHLTEMSLRQDLRRHPRGLLLLQPHLGKVHAPTPLVEGSTALAPIATRTRTSPTRTWKRNPRPGSQPEAGPGIGWRGPTGATRVTAIGAKHLLSHRPSGRRMKMKQKQLIPPDNDRSRTWSLLKPR